MADEDRILLFSFGGVDGGPRIEVSMDKERMTAWARLYHATSADGKLLVWSEFADALRGAGVYHGVLEAEAQEALFRFNTGHPAPETIVLARGKPPAADRPAFLKLEPEFFNHHFTDRGAQRVDFKEFSPFVIVKKGQLLARGIPAQAGQSGYTIEGTELPAGKKESKQLRPGPMTLEAHGKIFSRIAGRFTLEGDVFDVSDLLELEAGVDYNTGSITFPGHVVVKGVVSDGFRLAAGLTLTVKGPLDASEVLCHGDLTVEGGIIGKKPGIVRTGGRVRALFIEHCQVESLGPISVGKALMHARVFTNADLTLDDGGRIVSSQLWVKGVLTCTHLGGENGGVKVIAGTDFVVQRKMEGLRVRYQAMEQELRKEKGAGQTPDPRKLEALKDMVNELNTLTPLLFANPNTEIRVAGAVQAGTTIEMGYAALTVSQTVKGQAFKLSPDGKSILTVPWAKNPNSAPAT